MEEIDKIIRESCNVKMTLLNQGSTINSIVNTLEKAFRNNQKVLIAGNGGSAADSQHMAGELIGRFLMERKSLSAIALTTDSSVLTCWPNDYSFDTVFSRQVEAHGKMGDVFIGISTSGNSKNIIEAIKQARKQGVYTIALLGCGGGQIKELADLSLVVNSNETPRVQESHILVIHIICELLEKRLFG